MRLGVLVIALGFRALSSPPDAGAQGPPPIIDMHLHANAADDNGPPPMGVCIPFLSQFPAHDPRDAWESVFLERTKNPPCADPIWSPTTDQALLDETLAVLERRNIIGVRSGPVELVRRWVSAAPERLVPAVELLSLEDHEHDSHGTRLSPGCAPPFVRERRARRSGRSREPVRGNRAR